MQLTVAGDINRDERVDATDAQLLNQALGITSNNAGYSLNLDINRDGVINNSDVELLNQNLGFVANTPAVITPSNILTHQELGTTIDLDKFVSDADNDALAYSISNPVNGTLETLNDGQTVVFKPASNFAGVGSFEISVDDGYYKAYETININVSDAPLINLEIIKSKKQLNVGETISLVETFWQNVCTKEILLMRKMWFYQILI